MSRKKVMSFVNVKEMASQSMLYAQIERLRNTKDIKA